MAQTPRVVQVVVSVESQQFKRGMGDKHRQQVEAGIAAEIAAELARPFPIVDWRADLRNDVPVATLTAAVIDRQFGDPNDPEASDPEIVLVWRAKAGSSELEMPKIVATQLYSANTIDRPIDDFNGKFRKKLGEKTIEWVNAQPNQDRLKEQFLKHVLIATKVVPTLDPQFVVVPLPWQDVKLNRESVLRVEYDSVNPGGAQQMQLMLTGMAPRRADPMLGNTQTQLGKCLRGGGDVPQPTSWNECVAPLSTGPERRVSVFADNYIYEAHPDVQNGVITSE